MPTNVTMPQMGESIFEGTITKWLKKVGDRVNRDEPLFEISTEKVDSEIPSPARGILKEILFPEGSVVQVNTVVAIIGDEEEGVEIKAELPEPPMQKEPVVVPAVITSPTEPETPVSVAAEEVFEVEAEAELEVPVVGSPADIVSPAPPHALVQPKNIRTSPLVRRLAREHHVNLTLVEGTGLDGRITKQDILDYIERKSQASAARIAQTPTATAPVIEEVPLKAGKQAAEAESQTAQEASIVQPPVAAPTLATQVAGDNEIVLMTPMRKAIAEHMVASMHTSPHVHTVFEVDLTSVIELRDRYKAEFERKEGIKLTVTPFMAKALVEAVRDYPALNCSVQGESIVYKKPVNLGIAVALDNGLIVPVVKDAHLKSFTGLALGIQDLVSRARTKRLRTDEVQNGTITITNPGSFGELLSTPIINQPQVAILSVGSIEKRPVVINDMIAIRSMVYMTLAFDHRAVDGALADQFMAKIKIKLESWRQWIE
jgi:pyruvate dehydrogenase E2 component (dihydrolipoamide acetyltransferase)